MWHNADGVSINTYGTSISGYGDSIMAGGNASDAAHRFLNLVAGNYKILPNSWSVVDNQAVAATEIADIATNRVFPDVISSTSKSMALLGYNDMRHWGTDANGQSWFQKSLYNIATWLAIPQANKITGQGAGVTYSGTWTNTPVYGNGLGKYTVTTNDYVEFTVHGTAMYVGLTALVGATGGNYKIEVDGIERATGASYGVAAPNSGLTHTPFVVRIADLSDADHTVRVTNTGGTSPNTLYFNWAAGNENTTNFFLGNTLSMNATGYALGGASWDNGSDTAVSQFNAIISNVASTLSGDGLKVQYVDANSLYNLSTDVATDNVHPNDSGHQHIADAFISAINVSTLTQGLSLAAISDSTVNLLSGTKKGTDEPIAAEGKIGTAQQFDGSNDYINFGNNSLLDFTSSAFSLSGWVKITNIAVAQDLFCRGLWETDGYYLQLNLSQLGFTTNQSGAYQSTLSATNPFLNNTWTYVSATRSGSTAKIYVNGAEVTYSAQGTHINPTTSTKNAYMGIYNSLALPLGGLMDEVRVSSVARSDAWIKFEYYNESSTTNELTFVGQEVAPSTEALITSFNFTSLSATGSINNTNHTVALAVPCGTSVTSLIPTISVSTGATIFPTSGTAENFTSPVAYTVTAQDGITTNIYTITVTVPPLISGVASVSNSSGATITWTTDEVSSSLVEYGLTSSYGTSTSEADTGTRVINHSVLLSNLSTCTRYYYRVHSKDATSNESIVVGNSFLTTDCGGGGLPSGAYTPPTSPAGGFNMLINNNAGTTTSPNVTLSLTAGTDTKNMAISNLPDFINATQELYQPTKQWNLCQQRTTCPAGQYTVYVKFYTQYGQVSETVQDSINKTTDATAPITQTTPTMSADQRATLIAQIRQQLISLITQLIQMLYLEVEQMRR